MIKVQLLGGASLRAGDVPLAGPPAQRHRIALLSLIVAEWPQPLAPSSTRPSTGLGVVEGVVECRKRAVEDRVLARFKLA